MNLRLFWPVALAAWLILFAFALLSPAGAHGPWAWIMENEETKWCCGPKDCERVEGKVYRTPEGWKVLGLKGALKSGDSGLYHFSKDGKAWACRNPATNRLRCLFKPVEGS
jgi:hypothetical protein